MGFVLGLDTALLMEEKDQYGGALSFKQIATQSDTDKAFHHSQKKTREVFSLEEHPPTTPTPPITSFNIESIVKKPAQRLCVVGIELSDNSWLMHRLIQSERDNYLAGSILCDLYIMHMQPSCSKLITLMRTIRASGDESEWAEHPGSSTLTVFFLLRRPYALISPSICYHLTSALSDWT